MKTIVLTFIQTVLLAAVTFSLHAQQPVSLTESNYADTAIERFHGGFKLAGTDERISKETLSQMFDENTFALYSKAHKEHVAAMSLWGVSGACITLSAISFGLGAYSKYAWDKTHKYMASEYGGTYMGFMYYWFGGITLAAAVLPAIPAWILTKDSHRKLDGIADTFNGRKSEVSLNIGFTPSGFGLVLNF